jgi:hypothetical protein
MQLNVHNKFISLADGHIPGKEVDSIVDSIEVYLYHIYEFSLVDPLIIFQMW